MWLRASTFAFQEPIVVGDLADVAAETTRTAVTVMGPEMGSALRGSCWAIDELRRTVVAVSLWDAPEAAEAVSTQRHAAIRRAFDSIAGSEPTVKTRVFRVLRATGRGADQSWAQVVELRLSASLSDESLLEVDDLRQRKLPQREGYHGHLVLIDPPGRLAVQVSLWSHPAPPEDGLELEWGSAIAERVGTQPTVIVRRFDVGWTLDATRAAPSD